MHRKLFMHWDMPTKANTFHIFKLNNPGINELKDSYIKVTWMWNLEILIASQVFFPSMWSYISFYMRLWNILATIYNIVTLWKSKLFSYVVDGLWYVQIQTWYCMLFLAWFLFNWNVLEASRL